MNKIALLLFLFLCSLFSCNRDNNPISYLEPYDGYGKLLIETDSIVYQWQHDEFKFYISIKGKVINRSDQIFYSRIGDFIGGDSPFYFADNSEAYLEKYEGDENVWIEEYFGSWLMEGTKTVPIQPWQEYSFSSFIARTSEYIEPGIYRFKLDHYDDVVPDSNTVFYHNYSNEFKIE